MGFATRQGCGRTPPCGETAVAGERSTREWVMGPQTLAAIGARVRRLRLERGWTQEEIGHPFSKAYVSQIEKGRVAPSLALLSVIAARLGTSIERLAPEIDGGHRPEDVTHLWEAAGRLGRHGEHESEVKMLEQASRLAAASGAPALHGQSLLRYADALRRAGQLEAALVATTDAFEVYGREGPSRTLGQCYVTAAMAYRDRGDLERARSCLEQALRHLPQRDVDHSRALIALGRLLLRCGMVEEAGERAATAADLSRERGDGREEAAARMLGVEVRLELHRPHEARRELEAARSVVEGVGDAALVRSLPAFQALVDFEAGTGDEEEVERCLQAVRVAGDDATSVLLARALVENLLKGNEAEAALRIAEIGIEHALRDRDWERTAGLTARQALALAIAGREEQAAAALVRSREAYVVMHRPAAIEATLQEIAERLPDVPPVLHALVKTPPVL